MKWLDGWFFRNVDRGAICPRGYGLAWADYPYGRDAITVCPIPFNVLIGFCRWAYFAFVRGFPRHHNDQHGKRREGFYRQCRCVDCGRVLRDTAEDRARLG